MRTTKTDKILGLVGSRDKPADEPKNPNFRVPDEHEIPVIYTKSSPAFQLVNVGFLLINEQLGQIMERFNCCMCEKCVAAITSEALRRIPPLFVEVRRKTDAEKVNVIAARYRAEVTHVLTKAVISVKSFPKH